MREIVSLVVNDGDVEKIDKIPLFAHYNLLSGRPKYIFLGCIRLHGVIVYDISTPSESNQISSAITVPYDSRYLCHDSKSTLSLNGNV